MKKLLYTLIFFVCILASFFITNSVFADSNTFTFHNSVIDKDVTVTKPTFLTDDYIYNLVVVVPFNYKGNDLYRTIFVFSNNPVQVYTDSAGDCAFYSRFFRR